MGEYANLQIREDMKRMFGYDPGPIDDNDEVRRPVAKRVKCPYCNRHPKESGLSQHIRDAHESTLATKTKD
jgi:hypothetical protein